MSPKHLGVLITYIFLPFLGSCDITETPKIPEKQPRDIPTIVGERPSPSSSSWVEDLERDVEYCQRVCKDIYGNSSDSLEVIECELNCSEGAYEKSEQKFLETLTPEQRSAYLAEQNERDQRRHERFMREWEMRKNRIDRMFNE